MPSHPRSPEVLQRAVDIVAQHGNVTVAARAEGMPRSTLQHAYEDAVQQGYTPYIEPFEVEELPDEIAPVDEIIERRFKEYERRERAERSRHLIEVKIQIDGPVGIVHFGDPHVDDPGCDLKTLLRHCDIVRETEGMFGANVGDMQNNWIGRLGHLYGEQQLTKAEAWRLTEEFVRRVQWLYLIAGNHDLWSGAGDPLRWISRHQQGVFEPHGARLNLCFPNGRKIRVNARHDFRGHSMWNPVHGAAKAAQMGWRDHILTCGHKHISGYNILKCPATGLISHAIRVAGYKMYDRYAKELGLPNQNVSPAAATIIQPDRDDDDPGQVTVIHDVETAAAFLRSLRCT